MPHRKSLNSALVHWIYGGPCFMVVLSYTPNEHFNNVFPMFRSIFDDFVVQKSFSCLCKPTLSSLLSVIDNFAPHVVKLVHFCQLLVSKSNIFNLSCLRSIALYYLHLICTHHTILPQIKNVLDFFVRSFYYLLFS